MKILIYSANFAPEPTGIGKYSGEMAAWLAARGHEVRAVAAPPYYPAWRVASGYRWPPYRREKWNDVDVWRAPLWVPKTPGGLARILHLASFAVLSFPTALRQVLWGPDLVVCVAPALVCAPAALMTARLCGAQAWLHIQDFEVDVAFRMSLLKGNLLRRVVLRMEGWLLRSFDVVSSISGRMTEVLLRKGVPKERIRYFPNWVDIDHIRPMPASDAYRADIGVSKDAVVVMFSGTLGGKQGLMVIPAVAAMLAGRKDIVFVVCGDGMMKPRLEAASAHLPNIRFMPLQPRERLGELLCMADIHLLPQNVGAADLVLPSKLAGMLASGRPVIATCLIGTELEAVVSQCGIAVPPDDKMALAGAICHLADDAAARREFGRNARLYAESNLEKHAILEKMFGHAESASAKISAAVALVQPQNPAL